MVNATASVYNLINVTEGGDILQFVQGVNALTGGWFMLGILVAGFFIMFMSMRSPLVDNKDAFVASGFITAVLAIFFTALNFINTTVTILIVLIYGVLFAVMVIKKD